MDKQFPRGFDCDDCYLNGVSTWAGDHTELFKGSKTPGVDATVMAVEGITGLEDQLLVDGQPGRLPQPRRRGRRRDAQGAQPHPRGAAVRRLLPVHRAGHAQAQRHGHAVVRPRPRRLRRLLADGAPEVRDERDARPDQPAGRPAQLLQDRRSVLGDDLDQRPEGRGRPFLDLAIKAKSQKIGTVSLVPPKVVTAHPDIDVVHTMVADAIDRAEGRKPAPGSDHGRGADCRHSGHDRGGQPRSTTSTTPPTPPPVTGGSIGSLKDGYAANQAEDLGSVC